MNQKTVLIMLPSFFIILTAFLVYNFFEMREGMKKFRDERTMTSEEKTMYDAVKRGDREEIMKMIKEGMPVDMRIPVIRRNERGADSGLKKMTPLMIASEMGDRGTVSFLLKSGADVNLNDGDWMRTPLIYALISRNKAIIRELVKNGADVNHREQRYRFDTWPIFYAIDSGDRETAELLIKSGADLSVIQTGGDTPFSYAGRRGREGIKKLLTPPGR